MQQQQLVGVTATTQLVVGGTSWLPRMKTSAADRAACVSLHQPLQATPPRGCLLSCLTQHSLHPQQQAARASQSSRSLLLLLLGAQRYIRGEMLPHNTTLLQPTPPLAQEEEGRLQGHRQACRHHHSSICSSCWQLAWQCSSRQQQRVCGRLVWPPLQGCWPLLVVAWWQQQQASAAAQQQQR